MSSASTPLSNDPAVATKRAPWGARKYMRTVIFIIAFYLVLDRALMWVLYRTPSFNLAGRVLRDQEYLKTHAEARRLVIIGDSRVRWTIDPRVLAPALGLPADSGLNISMPGTRPGDDLAVLHWLRASGTLADTKAVAWGIGLDRFEESDFWSADDASLFYHPGARPGFAGFRDWSTRWLMPATCSQAALQSVQDALGSKEIGEDGRTKRREVLDQLFHYESQRGTGRDDYALLGYLPSDKPVDPDPRWAAGLHDHHRLKSEYQSAILAEITRLHAENVRVILLDTPVSKNLADYLEEKCPEQCQLYQDFLAAAGRAGAQVLRGGDFKPTDPSGRPYKVDHSDPIHLTGDSAIRYLNWVCDRVRR